MDLGDTQTADTVSLRDVDDEALDLPQGTTLGRYVVLKRLGRGGMGVVYLGFDSELERRVAIKLLRAEGGATSGGAESRARMLREAQAMAKVAHPNVVAIHDVGTHADQVFLAMEYVHGVTLREWRKQRPRTTREIVAAYVQAGRGLEAAHAEGILHRDFKPENVIVDERGRVRVLDFGLARLAEGAPPSRRDAADESEAQIALEDTGVQHRDALATPLTRAGQFLGTPAYMPPEQLVGKALTARSDQFAFCVSLYEALSGELPFGGNTIAQRSAAIAAGRFEQTPSQKRIPSGVRRALVRGLSGAESQRFESMGELLTALERAVATPRWWIAGAAIATAGVAFALVAATRPQPVKPCLGAAEAIAPAWSAARADVIARAFSATGSPRADEAFAHTRALLDKYATSWIAMHADACEATRVRGVQSAEGLDLRMGCLQQRARELEAAVDLLAHADAKLLDDAVDVAARLTPVDTCVDLASLRAPFAPPKDDAQRRAVDDVRRKLAEVQALENTERRGDAYPLAAALVDEATRSGYAPVRAEALFRRGYAEYFLEKNETAETYFEAALDAERSRHDVLAAQAWTGLVDELGVRQGKVKDAAPYVRIADVAIHRAGDSDAQRAELLELEGWMAYIDGAQADGRKLAEQALALRVKTLGPNDTATLRSRSDLADRLLDEGEIEQALALYEDVYRARKATFGETHPGSVRTMTDIAIAKSELGDYAAALPLVEKAVALASAPVARAESRVYDAVALVGAGRVPEGIAVFHEGIALMKTARGDGSIYVASDEADFARALAQRGATREAEAVVNDAFMLFAAVEHRPQEVSEAAGVRALCRARGGDAKGAIVDADAALAVKEKSFGKRADLPPLLARGAALLSLHRPSEALVDLESALAIADETRGDVAIRAEVRFATARALVATKGDAPRAMQLATRAAGELESVGLTENAGRLRAWLAANRATAPGP